MKIITFAAIKGGVGKTTLAFNFSEWLARQGKKVLVIDLDHQCNLTQTYDIYDDTDTVANIFRSEGDVKLIPVKPIISPIIPSEHGYNAKFNLEDRLENFRDEVINYQTRESYITAQLYFIPNMIKHNTNSSRSLLETLNNADDANTIFQPGTQEVVYIPQKELFNKSTMDKQSIFEMADDAAVLQRNRKFFEEMDQTFQIICDII